MRLLQWAALRRDREQYIFISEFFCLIFFSVRSFQNTQGPIGPGQWKIGLTPNTFEGPKSFSKLQVHSLYAFEFLSLSSCWSTGFSDVHKTLLKSRKWLPAAFQKKSVQMRNLSTNRKKGILLFFEKLLVH
jgi:hypothetical protein